MSDLNATLIVLWVMYVYWRIKIRPLWLNRRQPVRRDAPTDGPWVKPEPERWKDAS